MLGSIMGALVAFVLLTAPFPTQAQPETRPIKLNGFAVEIFADNDSEAITWDRDAQTWHPSPPLLTAPDGAPAKSRYSIKVNGHYAEVKGWIDHRGQFQWLYEDQLWDPGAATPQANAPTAAMANGVVASKLHHEGKVTASDRQTQAAVESLIESAESGRLKPPSLKKPSLFPSIPWGWVAAAFLAVASLGFIGLAFILALWLILKRNRT